MLYNLQSGEFEPLLATGWEWKSNTVVEFDLRDDMVFHDGSKFDADDVVYTINHAEILKTPIRWEDGHIIPPTAPGIGVELNEDVAEAHPYTGTRLQLRMAGDPAPTRTHR